MKNENGRRRECSVKTSGACCCWLQRSAGCVAAYSVSVATVMRSTYPTQSVPPSRSPRSSPFLSKNIPRYRPTSDLSSQWLIDWLIYLFIYWCLALLLQPIGYSNSYSNGPSCSNTLARLVHTTICTTPLKYELTIRRTMHPCIGRIWSKGQRTGYEVMMGDRHPDLHVDTTTHFSSYLSIAIA